MPSAVQLIHMYCSGQVLAVDMGKGIEIPCTAHDAKQSYGYWALLIQPVHGVGSMWVDHTRARIAPKGWPTGEVDVAIAAYDLMRRLMQDAVWEDLPKSVRLAAQRLNETLAGKNDDKAEPTIPSTATDYGVRAAPPKVPPLVQRREPGDTGGVSPEREDVHRGEGATDAGTEAETPSPTDDTGVRFEQRGGGVHPCAAAGILPLEGHGVDQLGGAEVSDPPEIQQAPQAGNDSR